MKYVNKIEIKIIMDIGLYYSDQTTITLILAKQAKSFKHNWPKITISL